MIKVLRCITGIAFLVIQLKEIFILTEEISKCDVEFGIANCSHNILSRIPQDLGSDIKILDMSTNKKQTSLILEKDDLKNYPNLEGFLMRNRKLVKESFPDGFFKYSKELKMLNISGSDISKFSQIPATIEIFNYSENYLETFDISHLILLKEIYFINCYQLLSFPNVSKTAPLRIVDLRGCPLDDFSYSDIAAFCHLRYFLIDSTSLNKRRFKNTCCELHEWGKLWGIRGLNRQSCYKNNYEKYKRKCSYANVSISEESKQEYRKCFKTAGLRKFIMFLIVFIIVLLVLFLMVAALVHYNYKTNSRRKISRKGSARGASEIEENMRKESVKVRNDSEANIKKGSIKTANETEPDIRKGSIKGTFETEYETQE